MSLLLDALKKAAEDKQKASQDVSAAEVDDNVKSDTSKQSTDEKNKVPTAFILDNQQNETPEEEILTLETVDADESTRNSAEKNRILSDKSTVTKTVEIKQPLNVEPVKATVSGVSDEALAMLIYKTNRDMKNGKRIAFISIFLISLLILTAGGGYYYMDMQTEVSDLERKHQIAMQAMRHKTSQEETPRPSKIISSLVSEANFDEKVEVAKKHIKSKRAVDGGSAQVRTSIAKKRLYKQKKQSEKKSANAVSFHKTKKVDHIGNKLEQAWQHYDAAQYDSAKQLYEEVLQEESGSRDALLGLGAIAVIEKNNGLARKIYLNLLRKDPRDPTVIAALTGLQSDNLSLEENEKYLLDMLQKNPAAAELNFALANNYAQQKKWKAAQKYYFSAWQHDVENADYLFNLAVSLDQLGKSEQAIKFYSESLLKAKERQVGFSREAVQKRIAILSEARL